MPQGAPKQPLPLGDQAAGEPNQACPEPMRREITVSFKTLDISLDRTSQTIVREREDASH